MAKKKTTTRPDENKHDKFVRVVIPRVNKALKAIRLVGNQAGAAYAPAKEDVAHIIATLHDEIDKVEKRYTTKGTSEQGFSLEQ